MSAVFSTAQVTAADAYAFARKHGVESWFDENVIHPRTLQGRAKQPLKQREADRFQRLQMLVERATETFADESKALHWLTRRSRAMNNSSPLEYAAWERGFLAVLDQLNRIDHGIYV